MKKKIPCFCDTNFDVEIAEEIDLDEDNGYLEAILNGSFFSFRCPSCNKKHKPEFPISVLWLSKEKRFEVIPELSRGEFYLKKLSKTEKNASMAETLIGYPEMADRIAQIRDGHEPVPIEAIKYYLQLKVEEQYPDNENEIEIWYHNSNADFIEFHIHGIKEDEVAVMKLPFSVYEKTLKDYRENPQSELFSAMRYHSYLSYKNTMRPEAVK